MATHTTATPKAARGHLGSVREGSTAYVLLQKCRLLSRKRIPHLTCVGQPRVQSSADPTHTEDPRFSRALCICATLTTAICQHDLQRHILGAEAEDGGAESARYRARCEGPTGECCP